MSRACFLDMPFEFLKPDGSIFVVTSGCGPAKYRWMTVRGFEALLCEGCCAQWRKSCGPEVAPIRITLIQEDGNEKV